MDPHVIHGIEVFALSVPSQHYFFINSTNVLKKCKHSNQIQSNVMAFGKVFTKENLNDIPEAKCVFSDKEGTGLCDISFDEGTVRKSLEKLRDDKAAGADELVPRFLNVIKHEHAYPLTILFRSIMTCESVQVMIGKWLMWFQCIKEEVEVWRLITDRLV